ncbi:hypothetical protein OI18_11540 [Flavihumibacter solisilvae]|uniref:DUF218 domain-containing protein n=1 Tax=Flavihumibacter solisilvae TaxID=1349421 RepID=A0A0C1IK15_9BACT|nr:hypothetical protein OI18_11540 [Flavihumibacter solisilvae]
MKNYYFLSLLQHDPAVRRMLAADEVLASLAKDRINAIKTSLAQCGDSARCYPSSLVFTPAEIKLAGERLSALYADNNAIGDLVRIHLIPSGAYYLYSSMSPRDLIVKAWEQDANGINFVLGVYGRGNKPNYPLIDSISFDLSKKSTSRLYYEVLETIKEESADQVSFFQPSMSGALLYLEVNGRNEMADFEPMTETVNRPAIQKIKTIDWKKFKYSVILVPGAGPDDRETELSAGGMIRCRIAAARYREGMAPFIIVSGGRVHPYKTKFSEALEMKRYLIEKLNIPENAIILEPHARHTTTNMRNAARLIYHYGMPFEKPGLVATASSQSYYITDKGLDKRCQKELGMVPFRNAERLSSTTTVFYPLLEALHINPTEPLDP